jgi:hypothetical protein
VEVETPVAFGVASSLAHRVPALAVAAGMADREVVASLSMKVDAGQ